MILEFLTLTINIFLSIPNNSIYYHRCNMDNFKLFDCKAKVIYVKGKPIISRDQTLILKKHSGPDSNWLIILSTPPQIDIN